MQEECPAPISVGSGIGLHTAVTVTANRGNGSRSGLKQGPKLAPAEILDYSRKIREGEMSVEDVALATKRTVKTVEGWATARNIVKKQSDCQDLESTGRVFLKNKITRKISWGTGVRTFLPSLCMAFLLALEERDNCCQQKESSFQHLLKHLQVDGNRGVPEWARR